MIKRLRAKGFQIHKEVDIRFHPGINVITGASDAGKSSIQRMLRWVILNKPSGKSIVRKGATDTKVEIEFDNGFVSKKRKGNTTTYSAAGVQLQAIGKGVPDEVSDITNIDSINIQTQHNPYFLLVKSPGEVAKDLNDLAGISVIDKLFSIINSKIRETKAKLLYINEMIPETQREVKATEHINSLKKKVDNFAQLLKRKRKNEKQSEELSGILSDLQDIDNERWVYKKQLRHEKTIRILTKKTELLLAKKNKYENITTDIAKLDDLKNLIKEAEEKATVLIKRRKKIMAGLEECPLCGTILERGI